MTDPQTPTILRRKLLAMQLRSARENFVAAAVRLGDHAQLLALLEGQLAATDGMIGCHRAGPTPRELAATVALGALSPLRPYVVFVTEPAAASARAALCADDEDAAGPDAEPAAAGDLAPPRYTHDDARSLREAHEAATAAAQTAWAEVERSRAQLDGIGIDPERADECRRQLREAEAAYDAAADAAERAAGAYRRALAELA